MAVPPLSWDERDWSHDDEPVINQGLTAFNPLRTPPNL
jgi:hypothetical protein